MRKIYLTEPDTDQEEKSEKGGNLTRLPLKELQKQLDEAIKKEDYERAAAITG